MAKCGVTNIGGGGGIGSDEVSTIKDNVLSGKTYVGADTNDEIGTGTMANNGATGNQSLNAGNSFLVKKGYHAQDFSVDAISLGNQTPGTADNGSILSGRNAWVNGNIVSGSIPWQNADVSGSDRAWATNISCWDGVACLGVRNKHYLNGVNWIQGNIPNFYASNIKKGVNIGGLVGTFQGYVPTATDLYSYGNNIAGWYDGANSISLDSTAITIKDPGYAYMVTTKAYEHAPYSKLNIIALVQRQGNGGCSYGFQDQRTAAMFAEVTNVTTIGEYTISIPFKVSGVMTLRLRFWNYYGSAMQIKRIWLS